MERAVAVALIILTGWAFDAHGEETSAQPDSPIDELIAPAAETKKDEPAAPSAPAPAEPSTPPPATTEPKPKEHRAALAVEEIVVTAQRQEESINDVPIAVSAFSGEALQALGVTDTRDLGNVIPGLSVSNSGFNKPVYTLRGVGFNETSQTASSTVGVYLDEINFPFDVMTKGANLDLQRVEVLKGPQGTLYGRNTTGGAVNYVANKPTDEFASGFSASFGRFLTGDAEGFISGSLSNSLKARFAVREIGSGQGWQYSQLRPSDHLGKIDKQSARLILDWQLAESLPITFTFQGWRDHSDPQAPQAIGIRAQNQQVGAAALDPSIRNYPLIPVDTDDNRVADWPAELPFGLKDRFLMGSTRADWALSDALKLTVQGAYEDYESNNSYLPISGVNVINTENRIFDRTKAVNLEARLAGPLFYDEARWQLGAFASRDTVYENLLFLIDTNSAAFPTPAGPIVGNRLKLIADQTARTFAVFGHSEWPFLDTLKATLGLRYTSEVRDYAGCSADSTENTKGVGFANTFNVISLAQGGHGGAQPGGCFTLDENTHDPVLFTDSLSEPNVSGRLSLDWKPADELLFYVSYSRGFKSGSFPAISASSTAQLHPVKQERLDAYEIGGKLTLLESALHVDFAVFHYDYKDKQLLSRVVDQIFGPLPILRNAPRSKVDGAEVALQLSPFEGMFLSAAGTYLKTRVIEFIGVDETGATRDFAGNEFNFAPRLSYALLANYVLPVTSSLNLTLGGDYNYKGKTNSVLGGDPLYAHKAYGVINARFGVAGASGDWSVTAWGRNLADKFYTVSIFASGDTVSRFAGQPRAYGLTVTRNFE